MSVSKRVTEAFEKMSAGDPEGALFQICAAIEETAKRERRRKGKRGYKEFIGDNMPLIAGIGIGPRLAGVKIQYRHAELPEAPRDEHALDEIVHHLMRCALYHSGSLPADVRLTGNRIGSDDNGTLFIPKHIVLGLIVAVVASPANAGERTNPQFFFTAHGTRFVLNEIWGKRDWLLTQLGPEPKN